VFILCANGGLAQISATAGKLSLSEFAAAVSRHGGPIPSFKIKGVVCAVVPERRMIVLQDGTATVLLELPVLDDSVAVGDTVTFQGTNCSLARGRFGTQIASTVVDNDQRHGVQLRTGSVFLEPGFQPFHLEWFNGWGGSSLALEYSAPDVPRQPITADLLWRKPPTGGDLRGLYPGLDYDAYNGEWEFLPDFSELTPMASGVATNLGLAYAARLENTALVFKGFIQIQQGGIYTFYLSSDDGSWLDVGQPAVSCTVISGGIRSVPMPETLEQALADQKHDHWMELHGEVAFAGAEEGNLQLDLVVQSDHVPVTVIGGADLLATNLLHRRVKVQGVGVFSHEDGEGKMANLVVPSMAHFKFSPPVEENDRGESTNVLLTSAAQVRRLKPEQAQLGIPVKITGVVVAVSAVSLVVQDISGGVYVHFTASDAFDQPAVGQSWEINGKTASGDFSPVIWASSAKFRANAAMPDPIHPTWDQLMNGSLDAEYVELHGVVTSLAPTEMSLLTPDGKVTVKGDDVRCLPQMSDARLTNVLKVGTVMRMRGCFTTDWNTQIRRVIGRSCFLYPAVVEVEDAPPLDPFSLPQSRVADLLWFDARASALQRIKLAGQIILARPGEYFLLDEHTGVRVRGDRLQVLQPGDLAEAVGFPHLSGAGLFLEDARVRITGEAPLPEPVKVSPDDLFNPRHDATLVQIEAVVIGDALQMNRRVFELQAGSRHFLAVLQLNNQNFEPIPSGSRVRLAGIYSSAREDLTDDNLDPFELILNDPADIVVIQVPPWWTVRRAITVAALLASGLGITMVWVLQLRRKVEERTAQLQIEIEERQRVEQYRVMEQERTRVAQDLHDELGVGLTQVGILGSLAKNPALSTLQKDLYLDQLSEAAHKLVTGLDEIVWAVNPKYDSAPSLADYFALFTQRFLNLAGIACRFDRSENVPDFPLDSRVRHECFLAFKEALNNVVRHSGATEVRLKIAVARDKFMISINDNGGGCAGATDAPGSDGIAGMRQRMEKLGGRCLITSELGHGTTVELSLPLEKLEV